MTEYLITFAGRRQKGVEGFAVRCMGRMFTRIRELAGNPRPAGGAVKFGKVPVTLTVDITPEVQAALVRQAAAHGRAVEVHAASLLEEAVHLPLAYPPQDQTARPKRQRPSGRKSLAQLFAESPFRGLDLDFQRDWDLGRDFEL